MHTSLSQSVSKRNNGSSNTGQINYSDRDLKTSAIVVIQNVYSFCTDGNLVYLESIPQNNIEHFRIAIGKLTDNLNSPIKIKPILLGHPILNSLDILALHLNVESSEIKRNVTSYARSKKVQSVKDRLKTRLSARDRIACDRSSRLKKSKQSKLTKGLWIG